MRTFHCDNCQTPVYFENIRCLGCGSILGILPDSYEVHSVKLDNTGSLTAGDGRTYRFCKNSIAYGTCNQLVGTAKESEYCRSCLFTEITPNLTFEVNRAYWFEMEKAKRRLLFSLNKLGLTPRTKSEDASKGLAFRFLVDNGQGIMTGHLDGIITITLAEADSAIRETRRLQMGEDYRTLLGHFRHEVGHFYWCRLILDRGREEAFRKAFGDERADYATALSSYYARKREVSWQGKFVTRYASSHPFEDWAETFAHFLHMRDVVETSAAVGLIDSGESSGDFREMIRLWLSTSFRLNELGRSVGSGDLYPFVLSDTVIRKMEFIAGEIAAVSGK